MHFYNLIKELSRNNKIDLFIDMDGVIASYDFGHPLDFRNKRPLNTSINLLKNISSLDNVDLYILSVCRKDYQIDEKNDWLDKYVSFISKNNRYIFSKESNDNKRSFEIKSNFLNDYITNNQIVFVDDDNNVLSFIASNNKNIILFQDSELID